MDLRLTLSTIRPWRDSDLESLVRHADNPRIAGNMRDRFPHPYTEADARAWLRNEAGLEARLRWAIDVDGAAVGGIGLMPHEYEERHTMELGYWLGEAYWGRGIATEAVRAMVEYAFREFDIVRLEAGVYEGNDASRRVLERAGFTMEGRLRRRVIKNGVFRDQFSYAIVREH